MLVPSFWSKGVRRKNRTRGWLEFGTQKNMSYQGPKSGHDSDVFVSILILPSDPKSVVVQVSSLGEAAGYWDSRTNLRACHICLQLQSLKWTKHRTFPLMRCAIWLEQGHLWSAPVIFGICPLLDIYKTNKDKLHRIGDSRNNPIQTNLRKGTRFRFYFCYGG